ncbi:MAG TPA: DUF2344 domain-containing protein [Candidatus Limnocylindrales bacterium]
MDRPSEAAPEARQRWRITFARDAVDADRVGRAAIDAWNEAAVSSGLPIARQPGDVGRPRMAFAAPLPAVARGERELLDLWLLERLPAWQVRAALGPCLPVSHHWVDAEDVWLGAPALAGQVAAADWRIELDGVATDDDRLRLARAVEGLDGAASIPRVRVKGTAEKTYDLRPLLLGVGLESGDAGPVVLRARTRFDPAVGAGRPDEVVGAVADATGLALAAREMTRTRLLLADELDRPANPAPAGPRPRMPARPSSRQSRAPGSARPGRN